MAFGRGGNGNRGGIIRHWKLILGILVVLYLIGSMSSRTGRGTSSHERPGGQQAAAAAAEEEKKAEEPAQEPAVEQEAPEEKEEPSQETAQEPQKEAPEETKEAQAETSQSAPPKEETASDGIRPEFKESMDAFEKFFDDYYDFCVKYSKAEDTTSMMMDYLTWMTDYAETMEKIDEIDEESLTPAEDAYYLEVMLRIEKRSLEAMQALGE